MNILLSNGVNKAVISSRGAELKSLVISDREIIWQTDTKYWDKSSPLLFPAVGNVKNNLTVINDKTINMPKHGICRDKEFIAEQKADNSAVFSYSYTPQNMNEYPFAFSLSLTYTLTDKELIIDYKVANLGADTMFYCIGAHPAFACGDINKCAVVFDKEECCACPVKNAEGLFAENNRVKRLDNSRTLTLSGDMFDNDVIYFDKLSSRKVTFTEEGNTLAVISFDGFETLGLWTPAGKNAPFLCIEPWCGSDDYDTDSGIFSQKRGIQSLSPNNDKSYRMVISAE